MSLFTVENGHTHTILELLYALANQVEINTKLLDELVDIGVEAEVVNKINEMIQTGELSDLINQTAFNDLLTKINDVFTGSNMYEREPYIMKRQPHGTFENACVSALQNHNGAVQVMGIDSKEELVDYTDRDGVIQYLNYELPEANVLTPKRYTKTSVQTHTNLSSLAIIPEAGDIVDLMKNGTFGRGVAYDASEKISGIVTDVDLNNNIIEVEGWYKMGDSSQSVIPSIADYPNVIPNPITKAWVMNANVAIHPDSLARQGVIAEYGLFNTSDNTNKRLYGVDVCNFAGENECGFMARGTNWNGNTSLLHYGFLAWRPQVESGFYAKEVQNGFVAHGCEESAFKTDNNRFNVHPDGFLQTMSVAYTVDNDTSRTINPIQAPIHIIGTPGEYNLGLPQDYIYGTTKLYTYQPDGEIKVNGSFFTKNGSVTQIQLKRGCCTEIFSDGTQWFVLNSENIL